MRLFHTSQRRVSVVYFIIALVSISVAAGAVDINQHMSPEDFSQFLNSCSQEERIQLAGSLTMLPKLTKEDFGKYGLQEYDAYAAKVKDATEATPLRPQSFNEVSTSAVRAAMKDKRIDSDLITVSALKRELVWVANNKLTYPFREKDAVDYHNLMQWVAKKKGISSEEIETLSTFALEEKISKSLFAEIWEKLSIKQRERIVERLSEVLSKKSLDITRMNGLEAANVIGRHTSTALIVHIGIWWWARPSVDQTAEFILCAHKIKVDKL